MEKQFKDLLEEIENEMSEFKYVSSDKIPDIDLYMDQVTTFMDEKFGDAKRYPEDKVLTKTMINNYVKNNLVPSPNKKKYSKDHMLFLIFVYCFKNFLSIGDIEKLLSPLMERFYPSEGSEIALSEIYDTLTQINESNKEQVKKSVDYSFELSKSTFKNVSEENQEYLQFYSFVSILSQDIFAKLRILEKIIDIMPQNKDMRNGKNQKK